jgi:Pregnancy-associated plasma protein-A/Viral BACON domain
MKKLKSLNITLLTIAICIYMLIAFTSPSIQAEKDHSFQIKKDGTIHVDGHQFKNISHYLYSDFFRESGRRCGTGSRTVAAPDINPPFASTSHCTNNSTTIQSEYYPAQTYTIPVVFHVIYKTDGTGNISDNAINAQMQVLNEDFGAKAGTMGSGGYNTKIQFTLAGTTRTQNDTWFNDSGESTYKAALGWDQNRYLNVYTNSASGYLGYAYLPPDQAGGNLDGVVMLYESIGGRNNGFGTYDQGRTLVHETGHYLGMLHTFDGGCSNTYSSGDLIVDTPAEQTEHYGCSQTSSCSSADPIHNYMNYTDDTCMTEFTMEQANRMICSLQNYRSSLFTLGGGGVTDSITVTSPNGGESWTAGSTRTISWSSTGSIVSVKIEYSLNNGSSWTTITSSTSNDGSASWSVPNTTSSQALIRISDGNDGSPSDTSNATFNIVSGGGGGGAFISLNRSQLYFKAVRFDSQTGGQVVLVDNSGTGTLSWSTSTSASWLNCSPSSGSGNGVLTVSVSATSLSAGSYSGTVSVSDANASNSPQTIMVDLMVINSSQEQPPFGVFATPISGSTVSSSIPVTGWVLDDVGVQSIQIYNGNTYIGDAVMVEGARPDVVSAFPGYPNNYKAGWGYMLLTNFLPGGGNGTYNIIAKATDTSGNTVTLGSKTINVNNNSAVKPFGAIDTPTQGGTASGSSFLNWGWVLTPQPNSIPTNGSTINVWVNGTDLGNPTYNEYRSDIATLFPGYANSNGAVGYFYLNTTNYDNGVHTIQWTATDSGSNTDGIGSRYFSVQNSGSDALPKNSISSQQRHVDLQKYASIPVEKEIPVFVQSGFNKNKSLHTLYPNKSGIITVETQELERLEIRLPKNTQLLSPRPIGSAVDETKGTFTWGMGPGFVGKYPLVFLNKTNNRLIKVEVNILPRN